MLRPPKTFDEVELKFNELAEVPEVTKTTGSGES